MLTRTRIYLAILFSVQAYNAAGQLSQESLQIQHAIELQGEFRSGADAQDIIGSLVTLDSDEIVLLMNQGPPLTRVYAFWAYVRKEGSDYRNHFETLVADKTKIKSQQGNGCYVVVPRSVGSYIFDIAEDRTGYYGTRNIYSEYLDSIAIALESYEDIRGNINIRLMSIQARPELYDALRNKALTGDIPATIGLAKYQNDNDTLIISRLLDPSSRYLLYGLMCVERFPHRVFEGKILDVYSYKIEQKYPLSFGYVCDIMMKYSSEAVDTALDKVVSNPDLYYYHFIQLYLQLQKTNNSPLENQMVKVVGRRELRDRVKEYRDMNYWLVANRENE